MSETLGSPWDKLTIVKFKQWNPSDDAERMRALVRREPVFFFGCEALGKRLIAPCLRIMGWE